MINEFNKIKFPIYKNNIKTIRTDFEKPYGYMLLHDLIYDS